MESNATPTTRSDRWRWGVTSLLLLATMINYMDRSTLANLAEPITSELSLSKEQYGNLEFYFGWAFAAGSLTFGILADRWNVAWLYPAVLLGWSAMGFVTGLTYGYGALLSCRTVLGFFEAGHWPCALRTTQALLSSGGNRMMGNSVLQSGASLGAIFTPQIIKFMIGGRTEPGVWRAPFLVVGATGILWLIAWMILVRRSDLRRHAEAETPTTTMEPGQTPWWREFACNRRFWALVVMVIALNITWQLIRAWLPLFLEEGRSYTRVEALDFNSAYFAAAGAGCLLAGAVAWRLVRAGLGVHRSRLWIFGVCSGLSALTTVVAILPRGAPMLVLLLIIGAGTLGLFPCHYSFVQELSVRHMGKAMGVLSTIGWLTASPLQKYFGRLVDQTHKYNLGIALVGLAPCFAVAAMLLLWREEGELATKRDH